MIIEVSNNLRIHNPSQQVKDYCKNHLVLDNPEYINAERMGRYTRNISKVITLYSIKADGSYILPFGTFQDIYLLCKNTAQFINKINAPIRANIQGSIKLYDYQQKAVKTLINAKNGVLQAPTGSGKTQMALQLIKELGLRTLWLTHTSDLLKQSKSRCEQYFTGDFGTITEGKINMGKDITFATVQTMSKLDPDLYKDEFSVIVIDEVHRVVLNPTNLSMFAKIINTCNCRYKYGISATLTRCDGLESSIFSLIGNLAYKVDMASVGDKRIQATHTPVYMNYNANQDDYVSYDGTLDYMKLMQFLSTYELRDDYIIDKVKSRLGHKQLILCHRVAHCERLAKKISEFAKCVCITGKVASKKRDFTEDIIIATYSLAKEGLDIPALDTLHLATPQKNDSTTIQAVGRIERNIVGKETPIVYDYVDESIPYCKVSYYKRRRILKNNNKL